MNARRLSKVIILFLSVIFISGVMLAGCATTRNIEGKPIPDSNVDKIINGTTTKSQIISMFGPPYSIKTNPLKPGVVTYKYRFRYKKYVHLGNEIFTASTRKLKEKLYIIMKNGIVISHSFTTTGNISLRRILKKEKQ
ncbi:MAG: hypothetical protein M1584_04220 [Deltaproteobacteria bacterium]|nr:hypothetical protein [Deltaproteobacteria bacterium]